jgi:hypothetical protein
MAKRSARVAAFLSSDVSSRLEASLRISERCCSSSSLVRHSIYLSRRKGMGAALHVFQLSKIRNSTNVLKDVGYRTLHLRWHHSGLQSLCL